MIVAEVVCITIKRNGSNLQTLSRVQGLVQQVGHLLKTPWYERVINNLALVVIIQQC